MGRKPNAIILTFFERGNKLNDSSNRYQHSCKACGMDFPKGRIDSMMSHLINKCTAVSTSDREKAKSSWDKTSSHPLDNPSIQNGQVVLQGPTVQLPIARPHWTPLETLAEASRQIGLSEKHDGPEGGGVAANGGRSSEPPQADRLELQEQYTLDNPPVSYEQRVQGKKQEHEKVGRRESNHSLPAINFQHHMADSRSSSPNLAMAASSMAAVAAARFIPSMVDPQLLNEGANIPQDLLGKSIEQALSEANASFADNTFHDSPSNNQLSWPMLDMGHPYQDTEQADKSEENNELSQNTYAPIAMNPSMTTEFSAEYGNGERPQKPKVRGRFSPNRRKEVQKVRKLGACIRCRMLRKPCSEGTPCDTCNHVESARVWKTGCIRTKLIEELTMYSSNLHGCLAHHEVKNIKGQVVFKPSPNSIEASQYPATAVFATFSALEGQQIQTEGNIDPGLSAEFNASSLRILDENNDDLPNKLEAYTKRISNVFYEREPSRFMAVTLSTAHALSIEKDDKLLTRVLELWSIVHILVDHETTWTMSERVNSEAQAGHGPLIDQVANGVTFSILCLQLNAAAEKKAASICKAVLHELERRLLHNKASTFETFLVAIVMLNCVEKSTWLYKSWEQESFKPRWPLDKPPVSYASQGDKFTSLLHVLLKMRNVPPKTYTRPEDGILASEDDKAQDYFQQLQLRYVDVLNAQANHTFDPGNPRCYELRFCSRLLLPSS